MATKELDVVRLYGDLTHTFGKDIVWHHPNALSLAVRCVAPTGLPLAIGFFNNQTKGLGLPAGGSNCYALTTYTEIPRNLNHRLMVEQRGEGLSAQLVEEDSTDYLEGYDSYPDIIRREKIEQPQLAETVRKEAMGGYILNVAVSDILSDSIRGNTLDAAKEIGLKTVAAGDYIGQIDSNFLE